LWFGYGMAVTDTNYNALKQQRYRARRKLRTAGWADLDRSVARALAAIAIGALRAEDATKIVTRHWNDATAELITRAAVNPTTTATALAPTLVGPFLRALAPQSAAVQLFDMAVKLDFTGVEQFTIPYPSAVPPPIFVAEGAPLPMAKAAITNSTVGPTHKILIGSAITNELEFYAVNSAVEIIGNIFADQTARNLDRYVFDNVAADAVRPAGLLNGVTPLTPNGAGSMTKDLAAIAQAIVTAGGNLANIVLIAGSYAATALKLVAGPQFDYPIFGTGQVADKTIIGIDTAAIASGYSGLPAIETTKYGVAHLEDTTPLQIATGAQGSAVLATPLSSPWQMDQLFLRVRMNAAWGALRPGAVQVINNVTW
jgi:hypothetical protein